ncbi:arf-GAP with SH3 domain, ANK repeat and PH domain-containing protein 2-like isoform X5 [Mus musculus]|uniref:arf-GAP with SH3 domain, ANK repeat and PH domain-containing protein 2-like isoform X4 n=1 Tax=Mus musculus TaxID=10090 RepID=UPI00167805E7|nr:arf-GAP with SH3 domain, ANK repeat and PH domain-containing protein 2-like isoform X4 [Mus musculus]XP_036013649.1 arf-GAP with SH3 domain, ANK repeat and PH domain-containing protein 2 isoform X10 [Mus musculus]XP_036013650.1 arf-GAP with SH3 domain, ANK repeat and PH domain-containing protein 2 isoform X11 [Mus musculus]XP_036013658.1 arf-GAP with SH3 domain, ANK repeat and PH domain-containing protein 2-like isoform X4 [Mus musculus]XP_036013659.1 arf-GAP with SH3 domain, ANK repeat and 
MPDQISVSEFVAETLEDYKAPTASSFTMRTAQCRDTVAAIEEATLGKPIILKDIVKVREEMKGM